MFSRLFRCLEVDCLPFLPTHSPKQSFPVLVCCQLLAVDGSGLKWEESPYQHQAPPEVRVYEVINGTVGNNQVDTFAKAAGVTGERCTPDKWQDQPIATRRRIVA